MKFSGHFPQWRAMVRDLIAIALALLGLTTAIALITHDCLDPCSNVYGDQRLNNFMRFFGAEVSSLAFQWCGVGAWILPVLCFGCFVQLAQQKPVWRWIGLGTSASLLTTLMCPRTWGVQPPALLLVVEQWAPQWFFGHALALSPYGNWPWSLSIGQSALDKRVLYPR